MPRKAKDTTEKTEKKTTTKKATTKGVSDSGFIETRVALSESEFAFLRRLATPSPI